MIPTKIVYMRPDRVIEQIPLEHIEERDRRLLKPALAVLAGPFVASKRRRGPVRGREGADQERGPVRQRSPSEESFDGSTTPEDEGEEIDLQSNSPSDDNDAPPPQPRRKRARMVKD
ncbi:hypothetical protein CsSME_00039390 [Camellia sinensis var. sinensis]